MSSIELRWPALAGGQPNSRLEQAGFARHNRRVGGVSCHVCDAALSGWGHCLAGIGPVEE
jgi:hypothetical protein